VEAPPEELPSRDGPSSAWAWEVAQEVVPEVAALVALLAEQQVEPVADELALGVQPLEQRLTPLLAI